MCYVQLKHSLTDTNERFVKFYFTGCVSDCIYQQSCYRWRVYVMGDPVGVAWGKYFEVKVFTFMQSLSSYQWLSKTIWHSMSFHEYCVKHVLLINLWIHRLIHLCFLTFFKKGLIFSVWLTFLQKYYITVFLVVFVYQIKVIILNFISTINLSKRFSFGTSVTR